MVLDNDEVPVIAFKNGVKIGEFPSCKQAAKQLFIRNSSSVLLYARRKESNNSRGVKSYKDGSKYTFKLVKT